jgi:hypothetical protein
VKQEDFILVILPFLFSGIIIFGHFIYLSHQNPQAHSRPLITRNRIEHLKSSELIPIAAPQFPNQLVGAMHNLPTNKKNLRDLLALLKSQNVNTLLLTLGITLDDQGTIIIAKDLYTSEETLIRWAKKTVSDAHQNGFQSYLAFMFTEEQDIEDLDRFKAQFFSLIKKWSSFSEEYHIPMFNPGITIGHSTFDSLGDEGLMQLITQTEKTTRKYYTGRIGIGICCRPSELIPRGYNQILLTSSSADISQEFKQQSLLASNKGNVEHVFLLDLESQRLSTLK